MHWYLGVLKNYALFTGRARRSEYWYFFLFNLLIIAALVLVDMLSYALTGFGLGILRLIYGLAVLTPAIAVGVRRLHDTNRSGWWLLLALVPLVGLMLIMMLAEDSTPSTNRYGPNPKYLAA